VKPALFDGESNPTVYESLAQSGGGQTLVAQARGRPSDAIRELQEAVRQADGSANVVRSTTASDAIAEIRYPRRTTATILAASGLIGLVLASLGLYGVVSYSVARRVRELGIRAALGAQEGDIIRLVLADGVRVVLLGTVLGLALALAAVRIVSATVVAVPAIDLGTLVAVPLSLAVVVLAACYLPARRAARVDPMVALREF
jgi:ABC-type antimicrobial peptide transport system permease subunit